jgi:hypothetical protein
MRLYPLFPAVKVAISYLFLIKNCPKKDSHVLFQMSHISQETILSRNFIIMIVVQKSSNITEKQSGIRL